MSIARLSTRSAPRRRSRSRRSGCGVPAASQSGARSAAGSSRSGAIRSSCRATAANAALLEERGSVGGDRRAESVAKLVAARDPPRGDAVAGGDRGAVELGELEPGRALDLLDRAEPLENRVLRVAEDQERDRDAVGCCRPEPGYRVLDRA